jgi:hypothetical protein
MAVMASSTSAERNSGQVMFAIQPCKLSRSAKDDRDRNSYRRSRPHVADQRIGAERECRHRGDRRRSRKGLIGAILLSGEHRHHGRIGGESRTDDDAAASRRRAAGRDGERAEYPAKHARDREGPDTSRATAGRLFAHAPATLQADQQANPESNREARKQVLKVHQYSFRQRQKPVSAAVRLSESRCLVGARRSAIASLPRQ